MFLRPVTPIDETRYLTVAWEMFLSKDVWVLTLNGRPYFDKPPLLFWLINVGWSVFGVNDLWPRLLTASFGLGVVILTGRCASVLLPERPFVPVVAAVAITSLPIWLLFTGAVMFDVPLTMFCLAAIYFMILAQRDDTSACWLLAGVMLGLAVLTKGPVAFVHVIPLALLMPWVRPIHSRSRWYFGILVSVAIAIALVLPWLVIAAQKIGGGPFLEALLHDQTLDRIVKTTHHLRPPWFYLWVLPVLLLPWIAMPVVWRGVSGFASSPSGGPLLRLLIAWVIPPVLLFSAFRGKQVHYLLPLLPAIAIGIAAALDFELSTLRKTPKEIATRTLTVMSGLLVITYVVIVPIYRDRYDTTAVSTAIKDLQDRGVAVGHIGRYHGQFQFVGRLGTSIEVIRAESSWQKFVKDHPDGVVVVYSRSDSISRLGRDPVATHRFRSQQVSLWPVSAVLRRSYDDLVNL